MDNLNIVVKKLRESRGITQIQLAEKAGVGSGTIGEIESGKRRCTIKTLDKIAKALDLTKEEKIKLDNAFMGRSISSTPNTKNLTEEDFIEMPVKAKASAGNGYINFEDTLYTKLIRRGNFCQDCYLIEVAGNSMEPLIADGSFVIVDPHQTEYIANKIYIVKYGDETFIKRVIIKEEAKIMVLKSINPEYEDVYIAESELSTVKLLGRAIKYVFEGNL